MPKMKTNKTIAKRLKVTGRKKLLRRHQLAAGHLKRNKGKGALQKQGKPIEVYKSEAKKYKKLIGI